VARRVVFRRLRQLEGCSGQGGFCALYHASVATAACWSWRCDTILGSSTMSQVLLREMDELDPCLGLMPTCNIVVPQVTDEYSVIFEGFFLA
jgi:hypothetical protein